MPDFDVPVLGEAAVRVVDMRGVPVGMRPPKAMATGRALRAVTDARSRLARFLPAGKINFIASTASGAVSREQIELEPGVRGEVEVRVRE